MQKWNKFIQVGVTYVKHLSPADIPGFLTSSYFDNDI